MAAFRSMALHDTLRELVVARGAGLTLMDDPAEFRGAIDDYVGEGEASVGELNVLVDAVRLGAVRRFVAVLDQGALPVAAIVDAGDSLARDRGSDDPARSRWAVAVLGFALGRVDDDVVQRFTGLPGQASSPLPPTLAPTSLPGQAPPVTGTTAAFPPPTTTPPAPPPPAPTAVPPPPPTNSVPSAATAVPPPPTRTASPVPPSELPQPTADRPRRRTGLVLAVVAVVVLLLAVGGAGFAVLRGGDDEPSADDRTSAPTGETSEAGSPTGSSTPTEQTEPLPAGSVTAVDDLALPEPTGVVAMASRSGGVRLAGYGAVESISEGDTVRVAPEGGTLLGFTLARFDGCELSPCRAWADLGLQVDIAGDTVALDRRSGASSTSFVVALPSGIDEAHLVLRADGLRQSLSLLDGSAGEDNIGLLARPVSERTAKVPASSGTFRGVTATASPNPGLDSDDLTWDIRVRSATLYYFESRRALEDTGRAYLSVTVERTTRTNPTAAPVTADWLAFTDADGATYEPLDLDRAPDGVDAVFVVPADLASGTLSIGGPVDVTTVNGDTITLDHRDLEVPLAFGG